MRLIVLKRRSLRAPNNLARKVPVERIDRAPRQGFIFGKQVRQNLIVAPAVIGKDRNHSGHVLGNDALGVEECLRDEALPLGVSPHDEFTRVEQVEDAGDGKIELFSNLSERQQLFPGEELR